MGRLMVADANGVCDSSYHTIVSKLRIDGDIVMVSWSENFAFNPDILSIKNPIIIDFCEYGWDSILTESHIWGRNSEKFPRYYNNDWVRFDNWVKDNPPKLLLKRELLKKDVSDSVKSIEYPCLADVWASNTKEEFNSRPLSVFQYWGRSNECRIRIHGEIWINSFKKGFQVCDNIYYINKYLNEERNEKWISLWIPHYARVDINNLYPVNNLSKLSLSWPGAGFKCFRTAEAPVNSIMVMHKNDFAWSYDWDETNCILVEPGREIEGIEEALKRDDIYDVYLSGLENCNKYRLESYIPHIEKLINERS